MNKLKKLLRRIDLCILILYLAYAFIINGTTVFIDYRHLTFQLPLAVVIVGYAFILALSVYVYRSFHKEPSDKQRRLIYLGWFAILPGILNLILLLVFESDLLYDYSGVFFGGLAQFLYRLGAMAVCAAFLILFAIVNFIVKNRRQKGKSPKTMSLFYHQPRKL